MGRPRTDPIKRFESLISKTDGCWLWIGGKTIYGYGKFKINGRTLGAHRCSYEFYVGPILKGLYCCHSCDVKHCVNPKHLWLGTAQDNMDDMKSKGRQPFMRGEKNGSHKLAVKEILEIRKLYVQGSLQRVIAQKFRVSQGTVSRICSGVRWSSL